MNFKERLEIAQRLLIERRVPNAEHGNNLHALLRVFGVPMRPPHFSGFVFNPAVYGTAYAIPLVLLAWYGSENGVEIAKALWTFLPVAGMLGVWKAMHYSELRKKHELPTWDALHRPASVFD